MNLKNLVNKYLSGKVVPILGCELFKIKNELEKSLNIHEYIIQQSFEPNDEWTHPPKMLSELPLANHQFDQTDVIGVLNAISDKRKDLDLLSKIAMFKHFKIFILASFFKEFEKEFRSKNREEEIEIHKNNLDGYHNLSNVNFNDEKRKIIYLFDNIDSERFALNDEELLESLYGLSGTSNDKLSTSLPSALAGKTLLFIGCDFSDWFMRYCIRVLYNMPYDKPQRTYIVNDNPYSVCQLSFFKKYRIEVFQTSPVSDFINDFWKLAMNKQKFENRFRDSRVFICYNRLHDAEIAQNLCNYLRSNGIDAWFDEDDKIIGSHFETITENIWNLKTKLMVSVISSAFVNTLSQDKNYVRDIEWEHAIDRIEAAGRRNKDDKFFIVPYFVDNPGAYIDDTRIPQLITNQFKFGELFGGFKQLYIEIEKLM